jgi:hypothetical protein
VSFLSGVGATVTVRTGHDYSPDDQKRRLNATLPFTLAFGGGGGG